MQAGRRSLTRDAAVDADDDGAVPDHGAEFADLLQLAVQERLAAKAGVNRHDQDLVDVIQHRRDHDGGGARIERHAGSGAKGADKLDRAMQMRPGFGVDGNMVGTGLDEGLDVGVDRGNHQMDVEGQLRMGAKRLQDGNAE